MKWIVDLITGGFSSPRTTVIGIVGALVILANTLGIVTITPEQKDAFVLVALTVLAWFAGDATEVDKAKK